MYKDSGTNFASLSPTEIKQWLESFDTVLTDCDGVIWVDNNPLPQATDVINKLVGNGKQLFFVTNNSTKTRPEFVDKSVKLGFNVGIENIISTAYLAAQYLKAKSFTKKVYVIGSTGITRELDAVGIRHIGIGPDNLQGSLAEAVRGFTPDPEVGAVIVGFDEHFSFVKIMKAASYLNNPEVLFIGTNTDERFPMPDCVIPGTGAIVNAVTTCAERLPTVMGKPNKYICDILEQQYNVNPTRTLMIGDRCNTDILLGKNCGFQTLLVETGIHKAADVKQFAQSDDQETRKLVPDVYAGKLGDLLPYL
ncbi:glycerol-3-phosphate phosphatase-like [Wyeomyia smithii]|uniref:glycerol-3-phosphate phosphatase-like n=1 Tax=Wyeomyia smithii TaxID=174621 RepID=UPI002467B950|nr:glycerol-3-phosphate phosphatase-like [Wyeomyia smithii]XP_055526851.1 glycerol-3-phosphate phosphatase-like [Wyeomyia smithii]XP_055526853.1 glycerol-3-phosphate phosphatase-like [Wyeomyia smithii]